MNKLPLFDETKLLKNPFSYSLKIEVTRCIDTGKFAADKEGIMHPVSTLIERQSATKIFHVAGIAEMVGNLSDTAMRLYMYIIHSLDAGKDFIRINPEHYQKKNRVKDGRTYKSATKELIRYNFIVNTEFDNVYWINPNLFFCGNRILKYPESIEIKSEWNI